MIHRDWFRLAPHRQWNGRYWLAVKKEMKRRQIRSNDLAGIADIVNKIERTYPNI